MPRPQQPDWISWTAIGGLLAAFVFVVVFWVWPQFYYDWTEVWHPGWGMLYQCCYLPVLLAAAGAVILLMRR